MMGLKIGVMPMAQGMRAVRLAPGNADIMVQEGAGEPHYYYTIDLAKNGPVVIADELIREVKGKTPPETILHRPGELHCTMWFKYTTGPGKKL